MRAVWLWIAVLGIAVLGLVLSGCNGEDLLARMASTDDARAALTYITQLRNRDYTRIEKDLAPELRAKLTGSQLDQIAAQFPSEEPRSVQLIGFAKRKFSLVAEPKSTIESTIVTYQFAYPQRWMVANIQTQSMAGGGIAITGLRVQNLPESIQRLNRFSLAGKDNRHYAMLVLVILLPCVILYTLYLCIRAPMAKKWKWLWCAFIVCAIGQLTLNWTTGALNVRPLGFQIMGAGFFKPLYQPCFFTIGFPLGALCFLIWRALHKPPRETPADSAPAP